MVIFVGKDSLRRPKNIAEQETYASLKIKELESVIIKYDNIANDNNLYKIKGTFYNKHIEEYYINFYISFDKYHLQMFENNEDEIDHFQLFFNNADIKEPEYNADVICYLKSLKEEIIPIIENMDNKLDWEYGGSDFSFSFTVRPFFDYYTCPLCERHIEDRSENISAYRFIRCNNDIHDLVVFDEDFINKPYDDGIMIENRTGITILEQTGDTEGYNIYEYMNLFVKLEQQPFKTLDKDRYVSGIEKLYIVTYNKMPAGYMTWNYDHGPVLRQAYILEKYRRIGIGSFFVSTAIRNEAGTDLFGIESPNEDFCKLLVKIGYAKIQNEHFIPIGWSWIQGM